MKNRNPFLLPTSEYKRRLDFFGDYAKDTAFYLSKMTGKPYDYCYQYVEKNMKAGGKFAIKDPRCLILEQNAAGDRERKITTMGQFLHKCISNNDLISPVFSIFMQPDVLESFQKRFMQTNVGLRKKYKKEMFGFKMARDNFLEELSETLEEIKVEDTPALETKKADIQKKLSAVVKKYAFADKKQNNRKTSNNSVSGTYTIESTPLVNPTAHSVLTSTCRTTSGYANANNEKMLAGNRHYWSMNIVINNITTILTHTDFDNLKKVMDKWQLHYPTAEEVMECITRGAYKYFRSPVDYETIRQYVNKLTPLEAAAFVYTGDFYHIKKHNRQFVYDLIMTLTIPGENKHLDNAVEIVAQANPDHYVGAMIINEELVRGVEVIKIKDNNNDKLQIIADTILNMEKGIEQYHDFIKTFFATTNVPASLAYFPSSVRHVALTSDTDSTIFTEQPWVMDLNNNDYTGQKANRIAAAVLLFASQTIVHLLALMSANFGINEKELFTIGMKNEFKFQPFCPSNVSKHYAATQDIREGNVFINPVREIKGVHMRSSNAPERINQASWAMLNDIMDTIRAGNKLDVIKILTQIADSERMVKNSIKKGEPEFCRYSKVKGIGTYKKGPMHSPYQYHVFWNEVFGPKYGTVAEPPYLMVKVATVLKSPSAVQEWIESFDDKALAERLRVYMRKNNKRQIATMYIPETIAENSGIPDEILEAANYRGLIKDIHKTFYIILEILGINMEDKKVSRLVSDFY